MIGDTITTPRGSSIHSKFPEGFNQITTTPRRVALDQFKRRLQFKDGAMSGVRSLDTYKQLERKEKMEEFHREQRGKRDDAVMKSRGCMYTHPFTFSLLVVRDKSKKEAFGKLGKALILHANFFPWLFVN